jgi:hypothetical protein
MRAIATKQSCLVLQPVLKKYPEDSPEDSSMSDTEKYPEDSPEDK